MSTGSSKPLTVRCLIFFLVVALGCYTVSAFPPRPLSKSDVLALVAGQVVSENIAFEIRSRGLAFTPDLAFSGLLKQAGADSRVFAALNAAKVSSAGNSGSDETPELLRHLTNAGKQIQQKSLEEAAKELSVALSSNSAKSQIGFVMGEVLILQNKDDQALRVYKQVLDDEPDFPQVHTRLSYCYHAVGDSDSSLREAKAALAKNADDPVAHLNAGLILYELRKYDAAKVEYQEAIRSKPDYALAYVNMAILLNDTRDYQRAIEMFKKAIALKPDDASAHYNLGVVYGEIEDYQSAIREYREAKRLDPTRLDVRQNLGSALMQADPASAITELRELVALAPDYPICHRCLGSALYRVGRMQDAEKEFRVAMSTDPADPVVHLELGTIRETEKNYDAALAEYRKAAALNSTEAYGMIGRVLAYKGDYTGAIVALQRAEQLEPANWRNHHLRGLALENAGNREGAAIEYKQAISLAPKELDARLSLALLQEKTGDWISALQNYHQAAIDEPPIKVDGIARISYDAQKKYQAAQERFQNHLSELRAAGKASEAASLEGRWTAGSTGANLDARYHDAIQASGKALQEQHFDEAETSANQAIAIAEKMQPQDSRVSEAVGQLGHVYAARLDYPKAEENFQRQLALLQNAYGGESPMITPALQNLAALALSRKQDSAAEGFFNRIIAVNQKAYGENNQAAATAMSGMARIYFAQKDFAKTEAILLHSQKIYEAMYGPSDLRTAVPVNTLCYVYDQWGKPEKSAPCHARMIEIGEKQFGTDSPYLVKDMAAEAQALRQLGRTEEATKLEQRTQTISAQSKPN